MVGGGPAARRPAPADAVGAEWGVLHEQHGLRGHRLGDVGWRDGPAGGAVERHVVDLDVPPGSRRVVTERASQRVLRRCVLLRRRGRQRPGGHHGDAGRAVERVHLVVVSSPNGSNAAGATNSLQVVSRVSGARSARRSAQFDDGVNPSRTLAECVERRDLVARAEPQRVPGPERTDSAAWTASVRRRAARSAGAATRAPASTPMALVWDGSPGPSCRRRPGRGASRPAPTPSPASRTGSAWPWGPRTTGASSIPSSISAPIARTGYRFVATDGGVFNYGAGAPFLGLDGRHSAEQARRRHGRHARRGRLRPGGLRRRASSPSARPSSTGPPAASTSTCRSWAWR